jgi:protein involved in polysaccharide export with SLBB domain
MKRRWVPWPVACAAVLVAACGATPQQTVAPGPEIEQPDTTVGPGDVFDIRVYGEKDLSDTFRVASDGTIDFPLIGTIGVSGKTSTEIAKLVEDLLKNGGFLKQPQVSILVKEYNSKKISVFGQVARPGTFPYQDGMSVVEAVSQAGGFNSMAKKNETMVIRVVNGKKERFNVPVESIAEGQAPNFVLRPGDIVFVPERIF